MEPKRTSPSLAFLVIGLVVLMSSVAFSLFAVYKLEQVYNQRKTAVEAQDSYDNLAKNVKDWVLVSHSPVIFGMRQSRIITSKTKNDLEESTREVLQRAAHSNEQIELVPQLMAEISDLTNSSNTLSFDALQKIDLNLKALNQIENQRIEKNGGEFLQYINRLTTASGVTLVLALLVIIYSIRARQRDDAAKAKLIETLHLLKNEAESASNLKSKFLSTVSHEIRTPLNGIIGISDILIHSPPTPVDRTLAKTINQSGKTLLRIINDILDFSKIEAGKIELVDAEFSIVDVLNQVLMTLSPKAAEKSINFNYEIAPGTPAKLTADSERLAQVFFNLIGNAIKFTQIGSVVIRVVPVEIQNGVAVIEFSVRDSGIGMTDRDIHNLFKPFVQIRKAGTSGEAGTGLGLSISQSIVKAMGGEITVESGLGRGSTFSFILPFHTFSSDFIETQPTFRASNYQEDVIRFEPLNPNYQPRILVVEDNPTNQIVAQSMLSRLGAEVLLAANGREGLSVLNNNQIDLVLMDCQMPVLDGFETTKAIRAAGNSIPILAMTANAFNSDKDRCLSYGMNDFIFKPVDIYMLREKLVLFLPATRQFTNLPLVQLDSTLGIPGRKKVVRAFLSTVQTFRESFSRAVAAKDLQELQNLGHRFKGASQTVGGAEFNRYCSILENIDSIDRVLKVKSEVLNSLETLERQLVQYS